MASARGILAAVLHCYRHPLGSHIIGTRSPPLAWEGNFTCRKQLLIYFLILSRLLAPAMLSIFLLHYYPLLCLASIQMEGRAESLNNKWNALLKSHSSSCRRKVLWRCLYVSQLKLARGQADANAALVAQRSVHVVFLGCYAPGLELVCTSIFCLSISDLRLTRRDYRAYFRQL